ncbi:MAG: sigma-54-dependent Fis family transcriptional regulator [Deltaproteobacteria bacterium]|nr:sigma-54-dependent Fis family transcriptional regulator [Deltaproteobacteria bacterium]
MKTVTLFYRGTPIIHKPISKSQIHIGTAVDNDLIVASSQLRECRITLALDKQGKWQSHLQGDTIENGAVRAEMFPGKRIKLGEYQIALSTLETAPCSIKEDDLGLIGQSPAMKQLRRRIRQLAPLNGPVLIEGESGTGKELTARAVHDSSQRHDGPFVAVNCGGITTSMAEDIFFGHERGAFTGANQHHRGAFERAHNGTLFLDEIGELPLCQQASLLRVLDTRTVYRIGSEQARLINFRLVAATNRNLKKMVESGAFRLDLYHRIATLQLSPPPLRHRKSDISLLATHFLKELANDVGPKQLRNEALMRLYDYHWPGNCRELKNALYKAAAFSTGTTLGASDFEMGAMHKNRRNHQIDDDTIVHELCRLDGNVSAVSKSLGIPRTTLRNRLKEIEIPQM